MRTSESVAKIFPDFIKAQGEFKDAEKNGTNPFFKSEYSTLQDVFSAVRPALSKFGLAVIQAPEIGEGQGQRSVKVVTRIVHTSGEWIESDISVELKESGPQPMGSAVTYLRRYSLAAMMGIASEEDDDGNATSTKKQTHEQSQKSPAPPAAPKPPASTPPSATKAAPTGDKFRETQERMKKLGTLPEEVILGFKERGWGQNKAAEWCETKGWDIAAIRHEMGLDVEQSGNTTEEIPFE
jgi:hypothetical protein